MTAIAGGFVEPFSPARQRPGPRRLHDHRLRHVRRPVAARRHRARGRHAVDGDRAVNKEVLRFARYEGRQGEAFLAAWKSALRRKDVVLYNKKFDPDKDEELRREAAIIGETTFDRAVTVQQDKGELHSIALVNVLLRNDPNILEASVGTDDSFGRALARQEHVKSWTTPQLLVRGIEQGVAPPAEVIALYDRMLEGKRRLPSLQRSGLLKARPPHTEATMPAPAPSPGPDVTPSVTPVVSPVGTTSVNPAPGQRQGSRNGPPTRHVSGGRTHDPASVRLRPA